MDFYDILLAKQLGGGGTGGGSSLFIINATSGMFPGDPTTVDKTFAEIKQAYLDGYLVILKLFAQTIYYMADMSVEDDVPLADQYVTFYTIIPNTSPMYISIDSSDVVTQGS